MHAAILTQPTPPAAAQLSTAAILALLTRENIGKEIGRMRDMCEHDDRLITAINKAALDFEASGWIYDPATQSLRVQSATKRKKVYTVTRAGCPCDAGRRDQPCRHRAMFETIQNMIARLTAPALPVSRRRPDAEYATALALADELFN